MIRSRPTLPSGHGELVERPLFTDWAALIEANAAASATWDFEVAGVSATALKALARSEASEMAGAFSERLGVGVRSLDDEGSRVVMTGHQPEIYHPGVWVKDFLLQRLSDETGARALDIVVDSDGFDHVSITSPCLTPDVRRCRQYLAVGSADTSYCFAPVPDARAIDDFCRVGDEMLATLPAPSVRRHFSEFCGALKSASARAYNLAEIVTFARRGYEASAATDYAELPVSLLSRSRAFATLVADITANADRFARAYNDELDAYRALNRTRSAAQPFPNLDTTGGRVELPLWALGPHRRQSVWAETAEGRVRLVADDEVLAEFSASSATEGVEAIRSAEVLIAPKALLLTLFTRMFCCDLFIHGVGGGRYDRVTDGVCRRYFGVEPPAFVVASLTMYLPLGAHVVTEDEISAARERLNRLEHNPDALLGEVEFDSTAEKEQAGALAEEKRELVKAISADGADKKALGLRIREVNAQLSSILEPLRTSFAEELRALEAQRDASEILTDRTYPFCFWSPEEVADKVR